VNPGTDPERRPETAETHGRQPDVLASFGLLHLAACLGTALVVVIAIILFD
jgi:hypothetical protein